MSISSWFHISYTKYLLNLLFAHVKNAISVLGHLFCPASTATVPAVAHIASCLWSDEYSSSVCTFRNFFFYKVLLISKLMYIWYFWCTSPNYLQLCQFTFTPPENKSLVIWLESYSYQQWLRLSAFHTRTIPTIIAVFPHCQNTKD